jgi:hypothetical protein
MVAPPLFFDRDILFQLRPLADNHFASKISLSDKGDVFNKLVQALVLDAAEVKYFNIMWEDFGSVYRRV